MPGQKALLPLHLPEREPLLAFSPHYVGFFSTDAVAIWIFSMGNMSGSDLYHPAKYNSTRSVVHVATSVPKKSASRMAIR